MTIKRINEKYMHPVTYLEYDWGKLINLKSTIVDI